MNSINLTSLLLFLAVVLVVVFLGGREINKRIEETIQNNYQTEIEALKQKLDKQSELINSIINLGNKTDEKENDNEADNDENDIQNSEKPTQNDNVQTPDDQLEFEYIKENGGITITRYTGKKTSVQIPNTIDQLPVLKIGENAFADTKVKSVTLPSHCTEIDWFAFYGCFALTTIYVSAEVDTIGYGAFDSCSKNLTIYCERGSFAQKYAQSFGISYSIMN